MKAPIPVLRYDDVLAEPDRLLCHAADLPALLKSKLLITGGSGSGKSRALRALCEQLAGTVQQIVFDFEGDLVTLTEVHDYLVAGDGGHVPAHPSQARVLAERVMTIGASIICNLSDLSIDDRQTFVAEFLGAMMQMPREQWRPCLVAIDEVQLVCPERTEGDPVSAAAVVDIAARGRKRGYGLVVTSQRMAKIRKDLVAECHNRLIGYISLPADMARAASELGFEAKQRSALKQLSPGEFYAFGPALSRETILVRNADVRTKEPISGTSRVAPAPASVQALLEQLGTLPPIGDGRTAERTDVDTPARLHASTVGLSEAEVEKRIAAAVSEARAEICSDARARIWSVITQLHEWFKLIDTPFYVAMREQAKVHQETSPRRGVDEAPPAAAAVNHVIATINTKGEATTLGTTQRRMLGVLKQLHAIGTTEVTREQLAAWSGLTQSGNFRNCLSDLRSAGCVETAAHFVRLTPMGHAAAHDTAPFANVRELHKYWLLKVGGTQGRMLSALLGVYPRGFTREDLALHLGITVSGTFRNYLSDLRKPGLIVTKGDFVTASALLFPEGLPR